ncbi:hypothetical protein NEUTE1DRAFT_35264 [Neurospora tetrasperma FGSC 2508]|uniref:Uncharacterized protein n=1 Tax=Neurospora tetrasperma (strain FGSC 2508 / ATCC MYA-4615 / P0657) TaxID=510951 RepID=F8ME48_NEUT8|nr:uncharacterized protein NEUTE1DRAFT_35264 [Neurospora tetrasperma FGSC 2508]EGO60732.1 hypothetical protein NEUTE1DRAFT_35264 [Neurospora tetrasperma FGSC 2508]
MMGPAPRPRPSEKETAQNSVGGREKWMDGMDTRQKGVKWAGILRTVNPVEAADLENGSCSIETAKQEAPRSNHRPGSERAILHGSTSKHSLKLKD